MADGAESLENFKNTLKELLDYSPDKWVKAGDELSKYANQVNKTFGQGRQRMVELNQAIADAVPNVNRLGGEMSDVAEALEGAALASRRNVVASAKDVEQLYAATKLLGGTVESLSNAFIDVGVGIEAIPKQLEDSMAYVRSIGGNTKQVFNDVQRNMDQMNRYQFEGGVVGLTKMAAQASMLRFNMNETFKLADKVLDPEGAVETAAAFQRLGVAAGNLADPFQLMNQSINDPSGLQDSLANVAKQFTYFDEKTKTFKINPQGVLTLREMEKQTGVSAAEMSKMGLAAAELDKRLSAVSAAGLKISSEEDKQFLANIAKLGKDGTYEVTLKDGTKKELAELQQGEFDELIKEQKEGPKTLEELQRASLSTTEIIRNDLSAIKNKIIGGVVSATGVVNLREQARGMVEATTGGFSKMGTTGDVRKETQTLIGSLEELFKDIKSGKSGTEALSSFLEKFGTQLEGIKTKFTTGITETTKAIGEKEAKKSGALEQDYGKFLIEGSKKMEQYTKTSPTTSLVTGTDKSALDKGVKSDYGTNLSKTEIIVGGKFSIDINLPSNFNQLDKEQQQKVLDSIFNSPQFQQQIANIAAQKNQTKAPISTNYSSK